MAFGMGKSVEVFLGMNIKKWIAGVKGAKREAAQFLSYMQKHKTELRSLSRGSAIAFASINAGIGLAVRNTAKLQDEVNNAMTLVNKHGTEYTKTSREMEAYAVKLSKQLGISGREVATSFYQVISAGTEAMSDNFRSLTETSLKLGKTVGLDTADTVEMLSGTLNAFNMAITEADRAADIFFTTSKLSATTVPQLAEAMKQAGPMAAGMGIEIETTAAILAGFAAKNVKGADAGTAFRMSIAKIAAATPDAQEALDKLGVSVFTSTGEQRNMIDVLKDLQIALRGATDKQKTQTLVTLGGQLGFAKLASLLESDLSLMKQWEGELKKGGSAQEGFNIKMQSFGGQLDLAKASLEAASVQLGKIFLPMVLDAINYVKNLLDRIGPWIDENKELVKVFGIAGAGGTGLLFALSSMGLMLAGLPTLITALTGPVGWIIGAVGLLGTAYLLTTQRGRDYETALGELKQSHIDACAELENVVQELKALEILHGDLEKQTNALRTATENETDSMGPYHAMLVDVEARLRENEKATEDLTTRKKELLEVEQELGLMAIDALMAETTAQWQNVTTAIKTTKGRMEDYQAKYIDGTKAMSAHDMKGFDLKKSAYDADNKRLGELNAQRIALENDLVELEIKLKEFSERRLKKPEEGAVPEEPGAEGTAPETYEEWLAHYEGIWALEDKTSERRRTAQYEYVEGLDGIFEEEEETRKKQKELTDQWERDQTAAALNVQRVFISAFTDIFTAEKNMLKATGAALAAALIAVFRMAIEVWSKELIAYKIKEIAKATAGAPLSFGATLAAIGPITIATGAGIAGLKALESGLKSSVESRERGGPIRWSGLRYLHENEVVVNPRRNTLEDVAGWLREVAPGAPMTKAFAGGEGGAVHLWNSFYGNIDPSFNVDEVTKQIAVGLNEKLMGA